MCKPNVMHLFLLKKCSNNCPLCCNNKYNIDEIPVATIEELKTVNTICLTGGEPFLIPTLNDFAGNICKQYPNIKNIYVYTSGAILQHYLLTWDKDINNFTGISCAPKCDRDWVAIRDIYIQLKSKINELSSNRLMIFTEQNDNFNKYFNDFDFSQINVEILGRKWDEEFKVPDDEIFRRIPILY